MRYYQPFIAMPVVYRLAGTGTKGYTGDNGAATLANLGLIFALAIDTIADAVYIADNSYSVIRAVSLGDNSIRTIAGTGVPGFSDTGVATAVPIQTPIGLAIDVPRRLLYFTEGAVGSDRIRRLRLDWGTLDVVLPVASRGMGGDSSFWGLRPVKMSIPYGVAIAGGGKQLVVMDSGNRRIRVVGVPACSAMRILDVLPPANATATSNSSSGSGGGSGSGNGNPGPPASATGPTLVIEVSTFAWPVPKPPCLWRPSLAQRPRMSPTEQAVAAGFSFGVRYDTPQLADAAATAAGGSISIVRRLPCAVIDLSLSADAAIGGPRNASTIDCQQVAWLRCTLPLQPDAGDWRIYSQLTALPNVTGIGNVTGVIVAGPHNASSSSSGSGGGSSDPAAVIVEVPQRGGLNLTLPAPVVHSVVHVSSSASEVEVLLAGTGLGTITAKAVADDPQVTLGGLLCRSLLLHNDSHIRVSCPVPGPSVWLGSRVPAVLRVANQLAYPVLQPNLAAPPTLTVPPSLQWDIQFAVLGSSLGAAGPTDVWLVPAASSSTMLPASASAAAAVSTSCPSCSMPIHCSGSSGLQVLGSSVLACSLRVLHEALVSGNADGDSGSNWHASFVFRGGQRPVNVSAGGMRVQLQRPALASLTAPAVLARAGGEVFRCLLPHPIFTEADLRSAFGVAAAGPLPPYLRGSVANGTAAFRVWIGDAQAIGCVLDGDRAIVCLSPPGRVAVARVTVELAQLLNITSDGVAADAPLPVGAAADARGEYVAYAPASIAAAVPSAVLLPPADAPAPSSLIPAVHVSTDQIYLNITLLGDGLAAALAAGQLTSVSIAGVPCPALEARIWIVAGIGIGNGNGIGAAGPMTDGIACIGWNASAAAALSTAVRGLPSDATALIADIELMWGGRIERVVGGPLTLYLRPVLTAISPRTVSAGVQLTLVGRDLCPAPACASAADIAVLIGGQPCADLRIIAQDVAACTAPDVPPATPGYPVLPVTVLNRVGGRHTTEAALTYPRSVLQLRVTGSFPTSFVPSDTVLQVPLSPAFSLTVSTPSGVSAAGAVCTLTAHSSTAVAVGRLGTASGDGYAATADASGNVVISEAVLFATFAAKMATLQLACRAAGVEAGDDEAAAMLAWNTTVAPLRAALCSSPPDSTLSQVAFPTLSVAVGLVPDSMASRGAIAAIEVASQLCAAVPRGTGTGSASTGSSSGVVVRNTFPPGLNSTAIACTVEQPSTSLRAADVDSVAFLQNNYLELEASGAGSFERLTLTGEPLVSYALRVSCRIGAVVIPAAGPVDFSVVVRGCGVGFKPYNRLCRKCEVGEFSFGGADTNCRACPKRGAFCSDGALMLLPDHYRPASEQGQAVLATSAFHACLHPEACMVNATPMSAGAPPQYGCAAGYEGALCGSCADGFARFGTPCALCWPPWLSGLITAGLFVLALGAMAFVANRTDTSSRSSHSIALRILMTYMQALGAIRAFRGGTTDVYRSVFGFTESLWASPFSFGPIACALKWSYFTSFMMIIFSPALAAAGVFMMFALISLARATDRDVLKARLTVCRARLCCRRPPSSRVLTSSSPLPVSPRRGSVSALAGITGINSSGESSRNVADLTLAANPLAQQEPGARGGTANAAQQPASASANRPSLAAALGALPTVSELASRPLVQWAAWRHSLSSWWRERRAFSAVMFTLGLAYMPIISNSLGALDCSEEIDGVRYLRADLRVVCGQGSHNAARIIAYIALAVVGAGFPLAVLIRLWPATADDVLRPTFRNVWASMFDGYRFLGTAGDALNSGGSSPMNGVHDISISAAATAAEARAREKERQRLRLKLEEANGSSRGGCARSRCCKRTGSGSGSGSGEFDDGSGPDGGRRCPCCTQQLLWWESTVLARKALTVLIATAVVDVSAQLVMLMVLLLVAMVLHGGLRPFTSPLFNWLEMVALMATLLTCMLSVLLTRVDVLPDGTLAVTAAASSSAFNIDAKRFWLSVALIIVNMATMLLLAAVFVSFMCRKLLRSERTQKLVARNRRLSDAVQAINARLDMASQRRMSFTTGNGNGSGNGISMGMGADPTGAAVIASLAKSSDPQALVLTAREGGGGGANGGTYPGDGKAGDGRSGVYRMYSTRDTTLPYRAKSTHGNASGKDKDRLPAPAASGDALARALRRQYAPASTLLPQSLPSADRDAADQSEDPHIPAQASQRRVPPLLGVVSLAAAGRSPAPRDRDRERERQQRERVREQRLLTPQPLQQLEEQDLQQREEHRENRERQRQRRRQDDAAIGLSQGRGRGLDAMRAEEPSRRRGSSSAASDASGGIRRSSGSAAHADAGAGDGREHRHRSGQRGNRPARPHPATPADVHAHPDAYAHAAAVQVHAFSDEDLGLALALDSAASLHRSRDGGREDARRRERGSERDRAASRSRSPSPAPAEADALRERRRERHGDREAEAERAPGPSVQRRRSVAAGREDRRIAGRDAIALDIGVAVVSDAAGSLSMPAAGPPSLSRAPSLTHLLDESRAPASAHAPMTRSLSSGVLNAAHAEGDGGGSAGASGPKRARRDSGFRTRSRDLDRRAAGEAEDDGRTLDRPPPIADPSAAVIDRARTRDDAGGDDADDGDAGVLGTERHRQQRREARPSRGSIIAAPPPPQPLPAPPPLQQSASGGGLLGLRRPSLPSMPSLSLASSRGSFSLGPGSGSGMGLDHAALAALAESEGLTYGPLPHGHGPPRPPPLSRHASNNSEASVLTAGGGGSALITPAPSSRGLVSPGTGFGAAAGAGTDVSDAGFSVASSVAGAGAGDKEGRKARRTLPGAFGVSGAGGDASADGSAGLRAGSTRLGPSQASERWEF